MLEISHSAEEEKTTAHHKLTDAEREATIRRLEKEMKEASKMLEFEYAALLRDQIIELRGPEVTGGAMAHIPTVDIRQLGISP